MNVAAVQFKADKTDLAGSRRRLAELARDAAHNADLVVLPEMAATGYVFPDAAAVRAISESARGETFERLAAVAAEARCWLVAGFPERDADRLFNSALVIDPAGELAFCYRKTLLFEADMHWATPGDSGYRNFDTDAGRFTVGICMDLNDDAFTAWCARADARAIAFPTNWTDQGEDVRPYWAWRLEEVPSALIAANTWGTEGDIGFTGCSTILDGLLIRDDAPAEGDAIIRATLPARPQLRAVR